MDLLADITIGHPTAPSYIKNYGAAGDCANIKGKMKATRYNRTIAEKNLDFEFSGATVETFGIFGYDLRSTIKTLAEMGGNGNYHSRPGGWSTQGFSDLCRQSIAVANQRGICSMLWKAHGRQSGLSAQAPLCTLSCRARRLQTWPTGPTTIGELFKGCEEITADTMCF